MLAMIGDAEIPNNDPYEIYRYNFYSLRVPLSFGTLFALFLVSLPFQLRGFRPASPRGKQTRELRRRFASLLLLFVLVYGLTFIAFFVTGRYRVPLIPFIAMGTALTLVRLAGFIRTRAFGRAALVVFVSAALIGTLRIDALGVRENSVWFAKYNSAVEMIDLGHLDLGIAGLEGVVADGGIQEPELYGTLIRAYGKRNAPGDARRILRTAEEGIRHNPAEPDLLWFAMLGHRQAQNWREAMVRGEQYSNAKPDDIRGWSVAFDAALAMGDRASAERFLARAAAAAPGDRLVRQMRERIDSRGR
jgi:hypothetical protein